jgi:hypothetical protein
VSPQRRIGYGIADRYREEHLAIAGIIQDKIMFVRGAIFSLFVRVSRRLGFTLQG